MSAREFKTKMTGLKLRDPTPKKVSEKREVEQPANAIDWYSFC
jgi:hypothetical protein